MHEVEGEAVKYLGLYDGEKLIGTAIVIRKDARRGRYYEIPGGPVMNWDGPIKPIRFFCDEIKALAAKDKCVFVRIRPNIANTEKHRETAKKAGLIPAPMLLHAENTIILDLTKSDDELLTEMRRQTRYEVRRAQKMGIEVTFDTSKYAFTDFYQIQLETAKRQNFIPSTQTFIEAQHEAFGDAARIYTASLKGRPASILSKSCSEAAMASSSVPAGRMSRT